MPTYFGTITAEVFLPPYLILTKTIKLLIYDPSYRWIPHDYDLKPHDTGGSATPFYLIIFGQSDIDKLSLPLNISETLSKLLLFSAGSDIPYRLAALGEVASW